jgi:excisionase family DNA binding protein
MAKQPARPQFLTPGEVAEQLRVSSMTVYRLLKSGELRSAKIGKSYRILQTDVDAYLEERFSDVG